MTTIEILKLLIAELGNQTTALRKLQNYHGTDWTQTFEDAKPTLDLIKEAQAHLDILEPPMTDDDMRASPIWSGFIS